MKVSYYLLFFSLFPPGGDDIFTDPHVIYESSNEFILKPIYFKIF